MVILDFDLLQIINWFANQLEILQALLKLNNPALLFLFVILCIILAGFLVIKVIGSLIPIIEGMQKLGFTYYTSEEKRLKIRRRQQFCSVLRSDLDAIAKAENWNDQLFTDLEAEVEAEGGYYSNNFARWFRRKSFGIRRIKSLIKAIGYSSERCILLVGDPGSGKSIALRHLARDFADNGCHSRSANQTVPLYINLKELPDCDADHLNANFIQQFVLDHIRRGDADTSVYVQEHWQSYKEKGIWLFLFDSFDEIPAVLHAPSKSNIIQSYSRAIRHFMEGMGECRGVLASREYKGPEEISWEKMRILPLNEDQQEELIARTFLSRKHKDLLRQHIATGKSSIFGNPLFMALLCRYVSANNQLPENDHALLINHIERLAYRDQDFISNKYKLNSQELFEGATYLAILIAEEPELSLAPKFSDIESAFKKRKLFKKVKIVNLFSALIDVKICRSDFNDEIPGNRKLAFSHRRYQETLFVKYLAQNPNYIKAEDLLLDARWREFAVTLLQSEPASTTDYIVEEAIRILDSVKLEKVYVPKELDENLFYFNWRGSALLHLLAILNEGFSRRIEQVPEKLRQAIFNSLIPYWINGDAFDSMMVMMHGFLMPKEVYQDTIQRSLRLGIHFFLRASFSNIQYLSDVPAQISDWARTELAVNTLLAKNRIILFQLDAIGNRLPKEIGGETIFKRCRMLSNVLIAPLTFRIFSNLLFFSQKLSGKRYEPPSEGFPKNDFSQHYVNSKDFAILQGSVSAMLLIPAYTIIIKDISKFQEIGLAVGLFDVFLFLFANIFSIILILCKEPVVLTPIACVSIIGTSLKNNLPKLANSLFEEIKVITFGTAFLFLPFLLKFLLNFFWKDIPYFAIFLSWFSFWSIAFLAYDDIPKFFRKRQKITIARRNINKNATWNAIRQAESVDDLRILLEYVLSDWAKEPHKIRSILSFVNKKFVHYDQNRNKRIYLSGSTSLIEMLLAKLEKTMKYETDDFTNS